MKKCEKHNQFYGGKIGECLLCVMDERDALREEIEGRDRVLEKRERWWSEKLGAAEARIGGVEEHAKAILEMIKGVHGDECEGPPDGGSCLFCDIDSLAHAILNGKGG